MTISISSSSNTTRSRSSLLPPATDGKTNLKLTEMSYFLSPKVPQQQTEEEKLLTQAQFSKVLTLAYAARQLPILNCV